MNYKRFTIKKNRIKQAHWIFFKTLITKFWRVVEKRFAIPAEVDVIYKLSSTTSQNTILYGDYYLVVIHRASVCIIQRMRVWNANSSTVERSVRTNVSWKWHVKNRPLPRKGVLTVEYTRVRHDREVSVRRPRRSISRSRTVRLDATSICRTTDTEREPTIDRHVRVRKVYETLRRSWGPHQRERRKLTSEYFYSCLHWETSLGNSPETYQQTWHADSTGLYVQTKCKRAPNACVYIASQRMQNTLSKSKFCHSAVMFERFWPFMFIVWTSWDQSMSVFLKHISRFF